MVMMCHCVRYNECTTMLGDIDCGGGYTLCGGWEDMEILCKLKTSLKIKFYYKEKNVNTTSKTWDFIKMGSSRLCSSPRHDHSHRLMLSLRIVLLA